MRMSGKEKENKDLTHWLHHLQGRVVGVENKDPERSKKILLEKISNLCQSNRWIPYSNDHLNAARQWRENALQMCGRLSSLHQPKAQEEIRAVAEGRRRPSQARAQILELLAEEKMVLLKEQERRDFDQQANRHLAQAKYDAQITKLAKKQQQDAERNLEIAREQKGKLVEEILQVEDQAKAVRRSIKQNPEGCALL